MADSKAIHFQAEVLLIDAFLGAFWLYLGLNGNVNSEKKKKMKRLSTRKYNVEVKIFVQKVSIEITLLLALFIM